MGLVVLAFRMSLSLSLIAFVRRSSWTFPLSGAGLAGGGGSSPGPPPGGVGGVTPGSSPSLFAAPDTDGVWELRGGVLSLRPSGVSSTRGSEEGLGGVRGLSPSPTAVLTSGGVWELRGGDLPL